MFCLKIFILLCVSFFFIKTRTKILLHTRVKFKYIYKVGFHLRGSLRSIVFGLSSHNSGLVMLLSLFLLIKYIDICYMCVLIYICRYPATMVSIPKLILYGYILFLSSTGSGSEHRPYFSVG